MVKNGIYKFFVVLGLVVSFFAPLTQGVKPAQAVTGLAVVKSGDIGEKLYFSDVIGNKAHDGTLYAGHASHRSHSSHQSHQSHYSHRSGF
jgi:hypothetical protein